jgi:alpha-galactosidase
MMDGLQINIRAMMIMQGLGDWQENKKKLPSGIGYLVKEASNAGVKFGIWVEPEMVSPKK